MTSSGQISDLRRIKWNLYFWKAHDKSYPKIQFLSILDKYFESYGNINAIWPVFGMDSSEIWPCHVTQAKNLSFPYLKSHCPLKFRKSHQISWFCCIPNGSYKKSNLKEGRICPPPPPCGIGLNGLFQGVRKDTPGNTLMLQVGLRRPTTGSEFALSFTYLTTATLAKP